MGKNAAITDEQIIAALLASGTIAEAAGKVGLSTRAVYDRMNSKGFQCLYAGAKTDIVRNAVFKINTRLVEAIDTTAEIMADKEINAAVRLQAAQTIINNAGKFAERLQREEYQNIENNVKSIFDFEL